MKNLTEKELKSLNGGKKELNAVDKWFIKGIVKAVSVAYS